MSGPMASSANADDVMLWAGGEGSVLVACRLGNRVLDTEFHPSAEADCGRLIDGVDALLTERTTT